MNVLSGFYFDTDFSPYPWLPWLRGEVWDVYSDVLLGGPWYPFWCVWTIFKVFIEFVIILLLFHILVFWLWSTWDLSSPTRNWTLICCSGRWSLSHWAAREALEFYLTTPIHCLASFFSGNKYNRWLVEETKLHFEFSWGLFNLSFQNK